MRSILNALQEGRLIELPDTNKEAALRYMASIMEAIPEINANVEIAEGILERENSANTSLGKGWACPHIRVEGEGELFSVIGWSPKGIDYGAYDNKKVHLVVMYYIPDSRKTEYLKELSTLAKAIEKGGISNIENAKSLNEVRDELLNWITSYIDSIPLAKAKMIRLEAKQAAIKPVSEIDIENLIPLYIVASSGKKISLSQDIELNKAIEDFSGEISETSSFKAGPYKIFIRGKTAYKQEKFLYDCIAVKSENKK